jgi:putative membrane protein
MSEQSANPTNELAKERNREAAERTLTSLIQNCVSLIAFGIAVDTIGTAANRAFWPFSPRSEGHSVPYTALAAIGVGVILLVLAISVHRAESSGLERGRTKVELERLSQLSAGIVILFGIVAASLLFLKIK